MVGKMKESSGAPPSKNKSFFKTYFLDVNFYFRVDNFDRHIKGQYGFCSSTCFEEKGRTYNGIKKFIN